MIFSRIFFADFYINLLNIFKLFAPKLFLQFYQRIIQDLTTRHLQKLIWRSLQKFFRRILQVSPHIFFPESLHVIEHYQLILYMTSRRVSARIFLEEKRVMEEFLLFQEIFRLQIWSYISQIMLYYNMCAVRSEISRKLVQRLVKCSLQKIIQKTFRTSCNDYFRDIFERLV